MAKIIGVYAGGGADGLAGASLDIHLSNGQTILFSFRPLSTDKRFCELLRQGRLLHPKTDGSRIYWQDGPSLTLEEIIKLM